MTDMADEIIVICGGNAKTTDTHLASRIVAIDDEIFDLLQRRERRRNNRSLSMLRRKRIDSR